MKKIFYSCLVLVALVSASVLTQAQTKEWSKKDAQAWYSGWVKNHKLVHPNEKTLDVQEFAKQYHNDPVRWDKTEAFLERTDLATLAPGKYDVDGENASATVSEGTGHEFLTTRWESHKAVADIHFLITGHEMVGLVPVATATVTKPFATGSDSANYTTTEGRPVAYDPGTFFVIFPVQAHQPGVKSPEGDKYKKVVVKVKVI